ncbi:MAG: hypothetical protein ACREF7_00325 [Candidatus Saccharimonadales bacterium]
MENQNNNLPDMGNPAQPITQAAMPMRTTKDILSMTSKITMITFSVTIILLALFGVIDIWHTSSLFGTYTKFEGTLGVLAFSSFWLNLGIRIYLGIKK